MKTTYLLLLFLCLNTLASAQTAVSVTKGGITWTWSEVKEFGQFANGDYWVQGPITITAMTPEWDGTKNGWQVNQISLSSQGYAGNGLNYSPALRPEIPFTVTSGSLIKVIGRAKVSGSASLVTRAEVLTVLDAIPVDRGVGAFRPPYMGTSKPILLVASLRSDILPSYPPASSAPSLAAVESTFSQGLRLEHMSRSRQIRPTNAMVDYQPANTSKVNEAMLRLMGDESLEAKLPALIAFTQHAIDKAYAVLSGYRHASSDGHDPNHRIMAAWGATMLNLSDILTLMATATGFHEDTYLQQGSNAVLWGENSTVSGYWAYLGNILGKGSRSQKDPYGFIDGGDHSREGAYQFITSQSLKGAALTGQLFPSLQACFPEEKWLRLKAYAQRWVDIGLWASPDPVAPYVHDGTYNGTNANYGVLYGPDGSGGYIAGAGRWPAKHGTLKDSGQYKNAFVESMWTQYFTSLDDDTTAPTISGSALNGVGNMVTMQFSEPVLGINLTHYAVSGHSLSNLSGSGATWSFVISPVRETGPDFNLVYTGGAGRTTDVAGNLLASSTTTVANNSLETAPTPTKPGRKGRGSKSGAFSR